MFVTKIHYSKIITLTITFMLSACGSGSSPQPPKLPPLEPELDYQIVLNELISDEISGVILLVETTNKRFLGSAGVSDIDTNTAMQPFDQMPTGSAGKPAIALLSTLLHFDGFLNLDDDLSTWLNADLVAQIPNGEQITLRQLLNHTSGIYNYVEVEDFFEAVVNDPLPLRTDADIIQYGLNHEAYFLPGEGFEYSNTGYLLAGMIMDSVLGEHHSIELRNRIIIPLGLTSTFYKGIEKELGDFTSGYGDINEDGVLDNIKPYQLNVARANAPLVSTVEDLALFLKSLISDEVYINQDVRDSMFSENSLIDTTDQARYGLGIGVQEYANDTLYFHNGSEPGYLTQNLYLKDSKLSISILINCNDSTACEEAINNLTKVVLLNEM